MKMKTKMQSAKVAGAAVLAGGLAFSGHAVELVTNGSFEDSNGFDGENSGFGWQNDADTTQVFDVYSYASQVYFGGAAPSGVGDFYFHTVGVDQDANGVWQLIDVTEYQGMDYTFSAWLSGWTASDDHPVVGLEFYNEAAPLVSPNFEVAIDSIYFDAGDYPGAVNEDGTDFDGDDETFDGLPYYVETADGEDPNINNWKRYEATSTIPADATQVAVLLLQDTVTGNGNDNYADLVSLIVDDGTGGGLMADFNLDGTVDLLDLDILGANWQMPGTMATGDANGDGTVDLLDLDILGAEWQMTASFDAALSAAGLVPEPTSAAVLALSTLVVARRRR